EDIYFTDVGCRLLDTGTCRCRDYRHRTARVDDCVRLTPQTVAEIGWLPPTCGYRLVAEGKELYWWHPLASGDPETVHQAGISVRGRVEDLEDDVPADALERRVVDWALRIPKRARKGNPGQDEGRRTGDVRKATMMLAGCAIAVLRAGAGSAVAGELEGCLSQEQRRAVIASRQAIPLGKALRAAKARLGGEVVRARLCKEGSELVYVLTVLAHDGKVTLATIDGTSGAFIDGR